MTGTVAIGRAEHLVRDRFREFQELAREKGTLQEAGVLASDGKHSGRPLSPAFPRALTPDRRYIDADATKGNKGFMREFFEQISELQTSINSGKANVKQISALIHEALQATTQAREQEVSEQLQDLVQDTNEHIARVKVRLDVLKVKAEEEAREKPNSGEVKIRKNMQQAMAKKHQQLLIDFQKAQVDFKKALERRQAQEMELCIAGLMPDTTAEQRANMIQDGVTASLVVARTMAGAHAMLVDEVQRIQEKHQDILRLEQNIEDLAQMFQEIAVLVDSQGEMLDAIEVHVSKTKGYTAKAEKNLIDARKAQHKARRRTCWIMVVLMVLLILIIGPLLISKDA